MSLVNQCVLILLIGVERAEDRPTRFLRVGQESMQRDARTEASLPGGWSLRE